MYSRATINLPRFLIIFGTESAQKMRGIRASELARRRSGAYVKCEQTNNNFNFGSHWHRCTSSGTVLALALAHLFEPRDSYSAQSAIHPDMIVPTKSR
jgi:hypothetical protein